MLNRIAVASLNQAKDLAQWWCQIRDEVLEFEVVVRPEMVVPVKVEAPAVVNVECEAILLAVHKDIAQLVRKVNHGSET